MQGWVTQDNEVVFYTNDPAFPRPSSIRLLMNTWERGVVSGLDGQWRPVFGVR
jgi:hypothetical protein